ncbi:hypothetical protein [Arthrobacter sp. CG_A4]|uniref:hypothetical protein n=1 Tax=Arthrobacter sp. CG_A4 TaxID=3071706 RepID=UPI002E09D227|nr:hypothetical protein [Arthrobacter sp. CG_A4]
MSGTAIEITPRTSPGRRRALLIPLTLLLAIGLALSFLFLTAKPAPSVPLGASALIPGGMASISEIVPLEADGWQPGASGAALSGTPPGGSHRVRLVVRLTALDAAGVQVAAGGFTVTGLGSLKAQPIWSSAPDTALRQGESHGTTLIFEVPDRAVALVLEGPGSSRLSMGLAHHSG